MLLQELRSLLCLIFVTSSLTSTSIPRMLEIFTMLIYFFTTKDVFKTSLRNFEFLSSLATKIVQCSDVDSVLFFFLFFIIDVLWFALHHRWPFTWHLHSRSFGVTSKCKGSNQSQAYACSCFVRPVQNMKSDLSYICTRGKLIFQSFLISKGYVICRK